MFFGKKKRTGSSAYNPITPITLKKVPLTQPSQKEITPFTTPAVDTNHTIVVHERPTLPCMHILEKTP